MKRGVTKRKLTKLVMVGIAGSGKSTSLQTVIGEEPLAEDQRTSTPLLTRPVQTEVVVVHDKVHWKKRKLTKLQTVTLNLVNVVDTFYTPLLYVYMFAFYNHQEEDVPRRSTKKK